MPACLARSNPSFWLLFSLYLSAHTQTHTCILSSLTYISVRLAAAETCVYLKAFYSNYTLSAAFVFYLCVYLIGIQCAVILLVSEKARVRGDWLLAVQPENHVLDPFCTYRSFGRAVVELSLWP